MKLTQTRADFYRFLSRLFQREVNQPLMDHLKGMRFPIESSEGELQAGYQQLQDFLAGFANLDLTELEADYAKVFLGAGISEGAAAFPYESVYTSQKKSMMQDARDQVMAIYEAKGLCIDQGKTALMEDHAAIELEFMAGLCAEGDIEEQKEFLDKHLLNWMPKLCADMQKHARTDFYQAVAKIAAGYLKLDRLNLEKMEGKSWATL